MQWVNQLPIEACPRCLVICDWQCKSFAIHDPDGNITIRSLQDGQERWFLPGPNAWLKTFKFSPDGRLLGALSDRSEGDQLQIWDLEGTNSSWSPVKGVVGAFAFSADSKWLAVSPAGAPIEIYHAVEKRLARTLPPAQGSLAFDPSSRFLGFAATPFQIEIAEIGTGETLNSVTSSAPFAAWTWNRTAQLVALGRQDGQLEVWDLEEGKRRASLLGHESMVINVAFAHRSDLLLSTSWDGTVRLWSGLTGEEHFRLPVAGYNIGLDPTDSRVCFLTRAGQLSTFNLAAGDECRLLPSSDKVASEPWNCAFSPGGQWLASAHRTGVRVWNVAEGTQLPFQKIGETISVQFDSSGSSLFTSGAAGLQRWLFQPSQERGWKLEGPTLLTPLGGALLPGKPNLALAFQGGAGLLMDLEEQKVVRRLTAAGPFHLAAIPGDRKWCAAARADTNLLTVFDLESGVILTNIPTPPINSIQFSPDGEWLGTAGFLEYTIYEAGVWRETAKLPREEAGYIKGVLAFSPDSTMAAIAHTPKLLKLIAVASGNELATLETNTENNISAVAFSDDGQKLAVSRWNHVVQIWDLPKIRRQLADLQLDWTVARSARR